MSQQPADILFVGRREVVSDLRASGAAPGCLSMGGVSFVNLLALWGCVASLGVRSQAFLSCDGHLSVVTPHGFCAPFADVCAYGLGVGGVGDGLPVARGSCTHLRLLHAGAAAALGEALRGAGVPTPHAALRHADVTLSPRRPRSCGQR